MKRAPVYPAQQYVLAAVLAAAIHSCGVPFHEGGPGADDEWVAAMPKRLCARLYPSDASYGAGHEAMLRCLLVNNGKSDVTVDLWTVGQPMYVLDVTDESGKRIPAIGPSTPVGPEERKKYLKVLGPGERMDLEYTLHIFSPELPPGRYTVTMPGVPSNTVRFRIRSRVLPW
ncbi:MAG: hypothetical protein JXA20_07030 [Spirochaetes bacterium]|nr:hypothetical protein [Spirochaetota bacterium]